MVSAHIRFVTMVLLLAMLTALQAGCVRRRLTIRSTPPGAVAYVDNQRIGVTPVSTSFTYYGTRKVELIKDGYETVNEYHKITAPWYQWIGLDFISENLWPFETRDERILDFQLSPQRAVPPTEVIERAEQLRGSAQQELFTAQPTSAHPHLDRLLHRGAERPPGRPFEPALPALVPDGGQPLPQWQF